MVILRIQHSVPDYDSWKKAFDRDPMDRRGSGVRRYHVYRAATDPSLVTIDLEFETQAAADLMLERLRKLWAGPGGAVMRNPEAWILERVETTEL